MQGDESRRCLKGIGKATNGLVSKRYANRGGGGICVF